MKYIDVRVRMPAKFLGQFVTEDCPAYGKVVGMDALKEEVGLGGARKGAGRPKIANGHYHPPKGSTVHAVLNYITRKPSLPSEVKHALGNRHKEKAINSGFYSLVHKGILIKQEDGTYAAKA